MQACVTSHIQLSVILWTVAHQAPLSMGFSRQEYWSRLSCPPPGDLPDPGTEPASPVSLTLQVGSLPTELPGKPNFFMQQQMTEALCHLVLLYLSAIGFWICY